MKEPKNIIIRMPNWIGDLVMATPVLTDLRKRFPEARITAMGRFPGCDLLKEDPDIDELFCFRKASGFGRRSERRNIIEKLRKGKYDLGILMTNSFSSAWWFWFGKVENRLGYDCNGRGFFLTEKVPLPQKVHSQHLVETYKMLLAPLGIPHSETSPRIYLKDQEIEQARIMLRQYGAKPGCRIVGINPGATYGSAKCWLPARFREVTRRLLQEEDILVIYFGDQANSSFVKEICQGFPPQVINLAGITSLRELTSVIKLCDVLLTSDSGPMHIADAIGIPIVALFGSTSEVVTGPYHEARVIHKHVECSPCYLRTCPIDFRCMKRIEADEVYQEIIEVLRKKRSKLSIVG